MSHMVGSKVKNKLLFSLAIFHDNVKQQNSSIKFHVPNYNRYKTAIQEPRLHSQADLWERNKAAASVVIAIHISKHTNTARFVERRTSRITRMRTIRSLPFCAH